MPRWIVRCPECEKEFTHTDIARIQGQALRDPFASPPKREIPEGGTKLTCPGCSRTSNYKPFDLRYRAD